MDATTFKKRENEIGIDMIREEASNISGNANWNRKGPMLCAEEEEVYAENVDFTFSAKETAKLRDRLDSPEIAEMLGLLDYVDKNGKKETEGGIEMTSNAASNVSDDSNEKAKVPPIDAESDEADGENEVLRMQKELNALLDQLEPKPPSSEREHRGEDSVPSTPPLFWELLSHTKVHLAAMKAFASFARDKFQDAELGKRYQKALLEHIAKTMYLLNSYTDYLYLSNPPRKTNTIHTLIEEAFTQHNAGLKGREIVIVNKQLERDLPETTVPEVQLRFIFESLMKYITQSIPSHGSLGLLTRLIDTHEWDENAYSQLKRDGKCIEILFVFSHQAKESDRSPFTRMGEGMELVLFLAKEVIQKNKGEMKIRPSGNHEMTFISLMLPVERRTVHQFPPLRSVERK